MGRVNRTISIEADREYVVALSALAGQSGKTIGAFVRAAIDAYCADDINRLQRTLAKLDTPKYQSIHEAEAV